MTAAAPARTAPRQGQPTTRRRTTPVPARTPAPRSPATSTTERTGPVRVATASRTVFVLLVAGVLVGGLVLLLLLHTMAAQDAFAVHRMSQQLGTLTDQEQQEQVNLERLQSPQGLQQRAAALGMRPSVVTSYQRLHDGRVVALADPSPPPVAPVTATPTPSPHATSKPGAQSSKSGKPKQGAAKPTAGKASTTTTTTGKSTSRAGARSKTHPHG